MLERKTRCLKNVPSTEAALLHLFDLLRPTLSAFIDDQIISAEHRGPDRLDIHYVGWIALGALAYPNRWIYFGSFSGGDFAHD